VPGGRLFRLCVVRASLTWSRGSLVWSSATSLALAWVVWGEDAASRPRSGVPTELLPTSLADGLAALQTDHSRCSTGSRSIELSTGQAEISVRDGYRVMYGYSGSGFFANVKVELSDPDRFLVDERLARQQIWEISQGCDGDYDVREYAGVYYSVLFHRRFGAGVLAMGVVSFPKEHTLVTAYLLDQEPGHRAFESMEGFRVLAARFFPNFIDAVQEPRASMESGTLGVRATAPGPGRSWPASASTRPGCGSCITWPGKRRKPPSNTCLAIQNVLGSRSNTSRAFDVLCGREPPFGGSRHATTGVRTTTEFGVFEPPAR
jgi:hypothetical protein